MIPKIIHYCWFGTSPLPQEFQEYIKKWHELMPDYEFLEWNDGNIRALDESFDSRGAALIDWCYADPKRLGFLSDYARFTALVKYGGFYVDTDVEILKPFDLFLSERHVFGYIFDALVGTATIGAEQGSTICGDLRETVLDRFGRLGEMTVSNNYVTQYLLDREEGFLLNGRNRRYGDLILLRKDYLEKYASDPDAGFAWHHCDGSWRKKKNIGGLKSFLKKLMGKRFYYWLSHKYNMHRATFKKRYRQDRKISKKDEFLIKDGAFVPVPQR